MEGQQFYDPERSDARWRQWTPTGIAKALDMANSYIKGAIVMGETELAWTLVSRKVGLRLATQK